MSISKKPKAKSESDVRALIEKGGSPAKSASDGGKAKKRIVPISLRLPSEFAERVEALLAKRTLKIPRHTWLLEAVVEKLEREEAEYL